MDDNKPNSMRTRYNKKWESKNREYSLYLKYRSSAKCFIRNKAKLSDLFELELLIDERRKQLENFEK